VIYAVVLDIGAGQISTLSV